MNNAFSVKLSFLLFVDMKNLTHGVYQDRKYESRCYLHALLYLCINTPNV